MENRSIKLNQSEMPLVGFGTYLISNEDVESVIYQAIEAGYRHIDTAQGYFNEERIGKAITRAISKNIIKREDIYITTKLWLGNEAWGDKPKSYDESNSRF